MECIWIFAVFIIKNTYWTLFQLTIDQPPSLEKFNSNILSDESESEEEPPQLEAMAVTRTRKISKREDTPVITQKNGKVIEKREVSVKCNVSCL